jgi:hypothetical protein
MTYIDGFVAAVPTPSRAPQCQAEPVFSGCSRPAAIARVIRVRVHGFEMAACANSLAETPMPFKVFQPTLGSKSCTRDE